MNENKPLILLCRCSCGEVSFTQAQERMARALEGAGLPFQSVDDLCGLAAHKDADLRETLANRPVTVLACHSRAVKWLLRAGGADASRTTLLNSRGEATEPIVARLIENGHQIGEISAFSFKKNGDWVPWFPVIDFERCKNCKQCLSFCLFGVYGLDDKGHVSVVHPQGCKTNCPACARICPEVAIIFPKYNQAPINGAPILDEDSERAKVKVNVQEILGSDVYGALSERKKKARSLLARKSAGVGGLDLSRSRPVLPPKP
jgi:NAD-dependent dihydropyrimidine dehydrogenase PreA subunit